MYPWFEGQHAWTVSRDDSFEALERPFPGSTLWDKFTVEPETGRVLGVDENGIYAFDGATGQFRLIVRAYNRKRGDEVVDTSAFYRIHTIEHVAHLGLTLIGTDNGVFQFIGETIRPLAGTGRHEVGPVTRIIDLPVHRGILFAGHDYDLGGGRPSAMFRHDSDGSVERLVSLRGNDNYIVGAFESRQAGRIVVRAAKSLIEVEMEPSQAGFSPSDYSTLMSSSGNLYLTESVSPAGEYLILGRREWWFIRKGLERLEADGLHTVPGDPVDPSGLDNPRILQLTAFSQMLIEGFGHRRYIYDGNRVALLAGADPMRIGRYLIARDLPSIEKVVLKTERVLFELTEAGKVAPLHLPFEYGERGFVETTVSEFPSAHVGLIATKHNLYALNSLGDVQSIRGGGDDEYLSQPFAREIPGRGVVLVGGKDRLHLIVTGSQCGNGAN